MDEQPPFQRHPGLDPGSKKNGLGRLDSRLRGNDVQEGLIAICVDDREAGSGVVDVLRAQDDTRVVLERLPVGDYDVDGQLLFERKTLVDLVASIKDGRLFRQAGRLASAPQRGVLILEGTGRDLAASTMRREAIQGALIYLTVRLNLPLLRARDSDKSARLMLYTARQLRTGGMEHSPIYLRPTSASRPTSKRWQQLYVLQSLRGIGPARAWRLLEAFGSIEAILHASADELAEVPGIGIRTATAIRHVVSEAQALYLPF